MRSPNERRFRTSIEMVSQGGCVFALFPFLSSLLIIIQKIQMLHKQWDSVFIPINRDFIHWYSAYIDFRRKHIHIYDSWQQTRLMNCGRPVLQQENSNLMLVSCQSSFKCCTHHYPQVLMWLAELLGQEIGMEAQLRNASSTRWICDPHKAVNVAPF